MAAVHTRLLEVTASIRQLCRAVGYEEKELPLKSNGRRPNFQWSPFHIHPFAASSLGRSQTAVIEDMVEAEVQRALNRCEVAFNHLLEGVISAEYSEKTRDAAVIEKICLYVENSFESHVRKLFTMAESRVKSRVAMLESETSKIGSFHPVSLNLRQLIKQSSTTVLEAAYSRCQVLNSVECSKLAELAGITHAQASHSFSCIPLHREKSATKDAADHRCAHG